jgi:hypothetical protein
MTAVSHCCHALQWVGCTTLAATNASGTRLGPVLVAAVGVWCRQTACPVPHDTPQPQPNTPPATKPPPPPPCTQHIMRCLRVNRHPGQRSTAPARQAPQGL